MSSRIGKYVCFIMDSDEKLDLYRDADKPKQTQMFDSVEDAESFLSEQNIQKYNIVKIEKDTF